jgi:protocatechuate 3,4-dioxygenase beta subunit
MKHLSKIVALLFFSLLLTFCKQQETNREISLNDSTSASQTNNCDDPDAAIECCFTNMPKQLTSTMIIPDDNDKSEKLIISGTIYKKDKTPYPNVILYAYHTDVNGQYSKKGNETGYQKWHGSHHGWCKTDKKGYYRIETIRPASYPKTKAPQHIHSAIKVPDNPPFYITDFLFKDDPNLPKNLQNKYSLQGGAGIVDVKKSDGVWIGKRDIVLE